MSNLAAPRNAKVPVRGSSYMNDFLREVARKSVDLVLLYPFQPILTLFLILARRELQQGCMRKAPV